jgi:5-(carboxyamino)imidazole ribonucleotide mutase
MGYTRSREGAKKMRIAENGRFFLILLRVFVPFVFHCILPAMAENPRVGIIMGSKSDWSTMQHAAELLSSLGVANECKIVSAHRTPDLLFQYAEQAAGRGIKVIIAGAGGAAHLPGMCASKTHLPVLGVPVKSSILSGVDSLLSIVQMPAGIPVGTLAIGEAGAKNAALLAAAILATSDAGLAERLIDFREKQTQTVLETELPE